MLLILQDLKDCHASRHTARFGLSHQQLPDVLVNHLAVLPKYEENPRQRRSVPVLQLIALCSTYKFLLAGTIQLQSYLLLTWQWVPTHLTNRSAGFSDAEWSHHSGILLSSTIYNWIAIMPLPAERLLASALACGPWQITVHYIGYTMIPGVSVTCTQCVCSDRD